jgi:hypothetical protein
MTADHFLKFPTESAMLDALRPLGMTYVVPTDTDDEQVEEWRDIPGYEGLYQVTNTGMVRSLDRPHRKGQMMSPQVDKSRYGHVKYHLCKNGKMRGFYAHQLVMLAFVGPCPEGMEVRHLNGVPGDNRVQNLRYGTAKENSQDSILHGTKQRCAAKLSAYMKAKHASGEHAYCHGEKSHFSKLTEPEVLHIRELREGGAALKAIGLLYDLDHRHVWRIVNRKAWAHV